MENPKKVAYANQAAAIIKKLNARQMEGYYCEDVAAAKAKEKAKQDAAIENSRKSQVGSGDRSEKIRTYNYPQGRITDHRIGLSIYQMENFLNGDLDEMIDSLITADTAEKLKGSEEE